MKVKINIKSVGIYLRPKNINDLSSILPNLVRWLLKRNKKVFFSQKDRERVLKILPSSLSVDFQELSQMHLQNDLSITLGGDGTLIGLARSCNSKSAPIFGINLGHLGFTTEFSKSEFYDYLDNLLTKKIDLIKLPLYKVDIIRKDKKHFSSFFVNDAVVSNPEISRMFTLSVDAENDHIYDLSGDGLIVSSPIGSTAYSLAAGGPIIHPDVNGLVITPICPHSLTHRPIVISDKIKVQISVPSDSENLMLTLDGQQVVDLKKRDKIIISRSRARYARLVCNNDRTYFSTLKEKFTHGRREL